ncbi:MAG: glycosyltransferase involved in cell wall biosynthesis [Flavobacterium sp.]|jgi:glycosyltransferase involved in cell wall biosynthesis
MSPKLSVVVPVFNVEKYLEKCLVSLENQTFKNFEVVIINDGSSDSSLDIANSFHAKDQRFRVISQENLGLGGARNTAIANARGEYIFMLDSDDYIKSDTFSTLIEYLEENDLDILVFNYEKVDEFGRVIDSPKNGNNGVFTKDEAFRQILSWKTSPLSWNKLYRTRLFVDGAIYYKEKFLHEDIPVTYKLFWFADRVGYLNNSFYYWVIRSGSITSQFSYKHINDVVTSLTDIKRHLLENSVYANYELEYVEGCVKMFNVMLERSIEHQRFGCMDYLLFHLDSGNLINECQTDKIELYDKGLYLRYRKNIDLVKQSISYRFSGGNQARNGERAVFQRLRTYMSSSRYFFRLYLYKISYYLFPLDSPRREALKKLLGRWQNLDL